MTGGHLAALGREVAGKKEGDGDPSVSPLPPRIARTACPACGEPLPPGDHHVCPGCEEPLERRAS